MTYTTKQAAIGALSALSLEKLNELITLSGFIFTPTEDQLLNVTFSQMVQKAHELADIHFPLWTDRSKSDFGEFLIELMALFSEKDFIYSNSFILDQFIDKTKSYSVAFIHAISKCGYYPKTTVASLHKIKLTFAAGESTYIEKGSIVLNSGGSIYTLSKDISLNSSLSSQVVIAEFLGAAYATISSTPFTGLAVELSEFNVDFEHIEVSVNNTPYTRVSNLNFSQSSDKHFIVIPEESGSAKVYFGRNGFGYTPNPGDPITVSYFHGATPLSNNPSAEFSIVSSAIGRTLSTVELFANTREAVQQETLSSLKRSAFLHMRTQGNIINVSDLVDVLSTYSRVVKCTAYSFANLMVFYVIQSPEYSESETLLYLADEIRKKNLIEGFTIAGHDTIKKYITVVITVYTLPGYNKALVEAQVKQWLSDYTDPYVNAEYGKSFILSEVLSSIVSDVTGVQNVVFNQVNGIAPANVVVSDYEITDKIDWDDVSNVINVV